MYITLISIALFAAFLLVLVILAQNSKGGGLTSQFGGSGASNIMGVKKTGDLLEKLTWSFVIVIMVVSLAANIASGPQEQEDILDRVKPGSATTDLNTTTPATSDTTGK